MRISNYQLALAILGLLFLASCSRNTNQQRNESAASGKTADRYERLSSKYFTSELKTEARIEDEQVFTEGPAVDQKGNVYFTNIRVNKILRWDPLNKDLSVFMEESQAANGLRFTPDGDLYICEGGSGLVTKLDLETGDKTILAEAFEGKGLQSPNDLDYDSSGRIYFSSRANNPDLEEVNVKGLYRADPNGSVYQLLAEPEVHMPNGVVVSPDEKILYLIEAHPDSARNRKILAFDLKEGELFSGRTLYDFYPGRSGDGMCIDEAGNLYVAAGLHETRGTSETLDTKPGIHVISPEGKLLAYIKTPGGTITNCTFGGEDLKTLYITCGTYLLSIRTKIAGKASYRPKVLITNKD